MLKFLRWVRCRLFHRRQWELGAWHAEGMIDWRRVVYCPLCNRAWEQWNDGPSPE